MSDKSSTIELQKLKKKVYRIVEEKGLYSVMNNTKWRELKAGVSELPFEPPFVIKDVDVEESDYHKFDKDSYYPGAWGLYLDNYLGGDMYATPFFEVEWIKVRPRMLERQGELMDDKVIDETEEFLEVLRRYNIPFEEKDGVFTIYGYVKSGYSLTDTKEKKMNYNFWGWENADVSLANDAAKDIYPGIDTPIDLYNALSEIWCEYTCAPRMRTGWSKDNMTLGQCSITAFLAQDIFGGEVYGILRPGGNYHCYNVVGEVRFDLTSEQFGDEVLDYEDNPIQTREVHFSKEEKRLRYEYLREELSKWCNK